MTPAKPTPVAVVAVALTICASAAACRTPPPAAPPAATAAAPQRPAEVAQPEPPPPPPLDAVDASPGVYKVLAESESARLLHALWQPGQEDSMHLHPEFVVYMLTDMSWKTTLLDGQETTGSARAGEVLVPGAGVAGHRVQNVGDAPALILILERKPGAAQPVPEGGAPSALDASGALFEQLADTEWVRVLRGSWEPKQRAAAHSHPEHFTYALTAGKWMVKTGPGERTRGSQEPGAVTHHRPIASHSIKNTGASAASILLFELK